MPDLEIDLPDNDARWLAERAAELGADVGDVISLLIASMRDAQRAGSEGIPADEFAKLLRLPPDQTLSVDTQLPGEPNVSPDQ